jgi:hypothetical protein
MPPFAATCIFLAHNTVGSLVELLMFVRVACNNPELTRADTGIGDLIRRGDVVERNGHLIVNCEPHGIRKWWAGNARHTAGEAHRAPQYS